MAEGAVIRESENFPHNPAPSLVVPADVAPSVNAIALCKFKSKKLVAFGKKQKLDSNRKFTTLSFWFYAFLLSD